MDALTRQWRATFDPAHQEATRRRQEEALGGRMPAKSKAQQRFMGAELARKRAGKETETDVTYPALKGGACS